MSHISLTKAEMFQCVLIAAQRQIENMFTDRQQKYGASPLNRWDMDIEGAAGEMAYAKYENTYWNGNIGNLKANDVGNVEVRTAAGHDRRLIVHPDDPNDRVFVLVTGLAPHFRIRGWIWGRDAKQERFWKDPTKGGRHAFFVDTAELRPMHEQPEVEMNTWDAA